MEIAKSVFGLTSSNNGFFKSEKQAKFLISMIEEFDGFVGWADSGYNKIMIVAQYDEQGITKLVKHTKSGDVTMWERKVEGVMTERELKEIKAYKRKLNSISKEITVSEEAFFSGEYDRSGDMMSYSCDSVELYVMSQCRRREAIRSIEVKLNNLKD